MSKSISETIINTLTALMPEDRREGAALNTGEKLSALSIDSLKIIELIFEMESIYEVEIDEHELQSIETVNDLITLIERAVAAKAGVKTVG